jgi:hypothetical protein
MSNNQIDKTTGGQPHNLVGEQFGRLTVVAFAGRKSRSMWRCICECGAATAKEQANNRRAKRGSSKNA